MSDFESTKYFVASFNKCLVNFTNQTDDILIYSDNILT